MSQTHPAPSATSRFSKWWPIGFFIGAVVFFVIGGALIGTYVSNAYSDCYNSYSYDSYYYSNYSCSVGNTGEFYGGVACLVIGGILKLIAWVLLIVYCVKRRRAEHTTVIYTSAPMPETTNQPFAGQQPYAAPQPTHLPPQ
ncbi:uncharacterized protein N7459_006026 [Penicillium hispanicum]|uniref:uncharacterized protein n=1 Tax=Penicillium hispanicum TaxID=1080232 RepID=UPI002541C608|nr:uncharacterized protein N7459_006026 [Penicillium hispanicum]KAJ5580041.1 hypothetical protein N7459_006026 [Penicillium hispanicum]